MSNNTYISVKIVLVPVLLLFDHHLYMTWRLSVIVHLLHLEQDHYKGMMLLLFATITLWCYSDGADVKCTGDAMSKPQIVNNDTCFLACGAKEKCYCDDTSASKSFKSKKTTDSVLKKVSHCIQASHGRSIEWSSNLKRRARTMTLASSQIIISTQL